jgi:hypothetical protein
MLSGRAEERRSGSDGQPGDEPTPARMVHSARITALAGHRPNSCDRRHDTIFGALINWLWYNAVWQVSTMTTCPRNITQSNFWQPLITSLRILISLAALSALPLTAMELPKPLAPIAGTTFVGGYVLPPGTVVLYRDASPWQRYTFYVVGAFCLVLVEALLIAGLLWQRAKRKKVETNLAISNERFRLLPWLQSGDAAAHRKNGIGRLADLRVMHGHQRDKTAECSAQTLSRTWFSRSL